MCLCEWRPEADAEYLSSIVSAFGFGDKIFLWIWSSLIWLVHQWTSRIWLALLGTPQVLGFQAQAVYWEGGEAGFIRKLKHVCTDTVITLHDKALNSTPSMAGKQTNKQMLHIWIQPIYPDKASEYEADSAPSAYTLGCQDYCGLLVWWDDSFVFMQNPAFSLTVKVNYHLTAGRQIHKLPALRSGKLENYSLTHYWKVAWLLYEAEQVLGTCEWSDMKLKKELSVINSLRCMTPIRPETNTQTFPIIHNRISSLLPYK